MFATKRVLESGEIVTMLVPDFSMYKEDEQQDFREVVIEHMRQRNIKSRLSYYIGITSTGKKIIHIGVKPE